MTNVDEQHRGGGGGEGKAVERSECSISYDVMWLCE